MSKTKVNKPLYGSVANSPTTNSPVVPTSITAGLNILDDVQGETYSLISSLENQLNILRGPVPEEGAQAYAKGDSTISRMQDVVRNAQAINERLRSLIDGFVAHL